MNKQSELIGEYRSFIYLLYGKIQSNTNRLEMMKMIEDFFETPAKQLLENKKT